MAQRYQPAGSAASGVHTLLKSIAGGGTQDAYYAAGAAKAGEDIKRLQRQNQQGDAVRQGLIDGKPLAELQVLAGDNAELQGKLPEMWRARILNDPHMTLEQKSAAIQGAGGSFASSELGFQQHEAADTGRARIAAGPGYAAAAASLKGHQWEHEDRGARLAQDYRIIQEKPEPLFDPTTNTTSWAPQGSLTTRLPGPQMPFSPEAYTAANKPTSYSTAPGGVPVLGRSYDLSRAFSSPNPPTFYAPTPDAVQTQQNEPMEAVAPGDTTGRFITKGDVIRNPGTYSPVPKLDSGGVTVPTPAALPPQADWEAEQALRGWLNVPAGLTGQGFMKGDGGAAPVQALPREIELKLPEMKTRIAELATRNNLNFQDAAKQVMMETYGTPGQGGFTINLPTFRSFWLANPTVTQGAPASARPAPTTPEAHPLITPQATRPAPAPAGPPRPPPNSPTAALTPPPPPAPTYAPAGTQPVPTIRLGGNPAPPPAPAVPAAPAPAAVPPAPAPAPAPAAPAAAAPAGPPRPAGMSNADLLGWGQHAIAGGAKPEDVFARLKGWGVEVAQPGP